MEKQIYGNITNTARTQFQFDRTYPNRNAMEAACDTDGIYAGRYVLVEYDNENLDCFTQLYKKGEKFYFAEFPSILARPGINIDSNGKLCYVRTDKDYMKIENNIRNIGSCEFYKTTSTGFELIIRPEEEKINPYVYNWNIDYDKYTRGFDSTVWQKLYMDGKERYIMIAELNTVVPQFKISADAPTMNPLAPHVSPSSTNVDYDLHIQSPWGFRVAQAKDGSLSDEVTYHAQYKKDENGELIIDENGQYVEEEEPLEIQADIYYNKDALLKYDYKLVDFTNHVPYEKDKYYYQRTNVYALDLTNYTIDNDFNRITFYKEKQESNPKTKYYYNSLELTTVDLLKSYETNWQPRTFYFISNQEFSIVVDPTFDENKQYYISQSTNDGNIIYTPVKVREDQYAPNKYYEARNIYALDENDSFQKEKEYYRKNVDDTYSLVDYMTVKPEYEVGKYYRFMSAAYILENQEFPNQSEQYYKLDGDNYVKVYFGGNEYTPYVYYKKVEDDYVLVRDDVRPEGVQLYERVIQAEINDAANQITVLPTGQSGRLYNNHLAGAEKSQEVANDIQEMSIMLPAIGNMTAEIWNLIYTKQRNDLIYENPFYDPNMYKEDQTPLYLSNLNSVVGAINKIHDLIGHNILEIPEMGLLGIIEGTDQIGMKTGDGIISKNDAWPNIPVEDIGKYIFKDDYGKYYRVIVTENTEGYTITPAEINDGNQEMQTLYEALLNIYEVLGTGETPEKASTNTLKGALFQLNAMIDEFARGFELLSNPDDSIEIAIEVTYRGLNGEVLYDSTGEYVVATDQNSKINAGNYKDYYIQDASGEYVHPTGDYDASGQYYYLSHYYVFSDEGMTTRRYYYENEAKYVIKYQKYRINHRKPTPTKVNVLHYEKVTATADDYVNYWVKDEITGIYYKLTAYDPTATYYEQIVEIEDTNEDMAELIEDFAPAQFSIQKFNATGHVLNPKYAAGTGVATNSNIILPQAIISATAPDNCPVGTLWYDISEEETPTT